MNEDVTTTFTVMSVISFDLRDSHISREIALGGNQLIPQQHENWCFEHLCCSNTLDEADVQANATILYLKCYMFFSNVT